MKELYKFIIDEDEYSFILNKRMYEIHENGKKTYSTSNKKLANKSFFSLIYSKAIQN